MSKYIYQISFDFSYAFADILKQKGDVSSLDVFDDTPELIQEFDYDWVTKDSDIIPDLILIMSKLPGVETNVYHMMEPFLPGIDTVEIALSNRKFKILTNIPCLGNTLNIRKSKVTRFSNGDIMSIESPVFLPGEYPALFKIEESPTSFFCSDSLFNEIKEKNLSGWNFSECTIKRKLWF